MPAQHDPKSTEVIKELFIGGGEMGELMHNYHWEEHPLGPPSRWPSSLRTGIQIILRSGFPMFIWWSENFYMFHNDPYLPALGEKHPQALGASARQMWSEIWDHLGRIAEGIMHGNEQFYADDLLVLLRRKGFLEETYWTFSYSPMPDDNGQVNGIFCACSEVTTKVLSERRLKMLKSLAESAIQATTVAQACRQISAILQEGISDLPFGLIYLNDEDQQVARLVGQTHQLPAGLAPAAISLQDEETSTVWPFAAAQLSGDQQLVLDISPIDMDKFTVSRAAVFPLYKADQNQVRGFFVAGINPHLEYTTEYENYHNLLARQVSSILSKVQAQEEERRRLQSLAEIDRAKTVFFNNISHEFRTPLTLMLGPLEEIRQNPLTPQADEQLRLIYRNGLRLLRLVNNLLEFSRMEAGRLKAQFQPLDLSQLTAELSSVFRSAVEKAGLAFKVQCRQLPEAVYVDPNLWERVMFNLLSNALKFTFTGKISVSLTTQDNFAQLKVSDTGVGIPAQELPHLFSRFHRVAGVRSRTYEGSGIGLAMVHEIVKLHGGTVSVSSTPDKGSTFVIRIPFGKSHLPEDQIVESGSTAYQPTNQYALEDLLHWLSDSPEDAVRITNIPPPPEDQNTEKSIINRPHLLFVDDNADMRSYFLTCFSSHYNISTAVDGEQAWDILQNNPPHLLVTDVMMPVMDGLELLRKIRHDDSLRTLPVILLSARAGEEAQIEGISAGAHDYLTKPFSARELKARIDSNLEVARLRSQLIDAEQHARHVAEQQQSFLLDLFQQAPVAIGIYRGPDHIIALANPAMLELIGKSDDKILGLPLFEVFPEAIDQGFPELLQQVYLTGEPFVGKEVPASFMRDGEQYDGYYNFVYNAMRDPEGKITGIIAVVTEVTEQVLARAKIEAKNNELMMINADLDNFVYSASHDLKAPISNIQGLLELLREELPDRLQDEDIMSILEMMEQSVDRFMKTISNLSEITKLQKEANQPLQLLNINDIMQDVLLDLDPVIQIAGAEVKLELEACPPIRFAPKNMRSILYNLVSNAIKYRSPDRSCRIHIYCEEQSEYSVLIVADNGLGIDMSRKDKLFAMFQRLHDHVEGAGIGLYIVKKIVENSGGRIEVDSRVNTGSTFRVFFKK